MALVKKDCTQTGETLQQMFAQAFLWDDVNLCWVFNVSSGGGGGGFPVSKAVNIDVEEKTVDGTTDSGVQAVTIEMDGTGGEIDGVEFLDGDSRTFAADLSDTLNGISYVVPTGGGSSLGPRIILTYVRD